jgi:hypothetical protein
MRKLQFEMASRRSQKAMLVADVPKQMTTALLELRGRGH